MRSMAAALFAALTLAACSQLDGDVAIGEQLTDGDDRAKFAVEIEQEFNGAIAPAEALCVTDAVFASDLTPNAITSAADLALEDLEAGFEFFSQFLSDCLDPTLDLDAPISGTFRSAFRDGFEAGGELTRIQSDCVIDELIANGIDARDIYIGAYVPGNAGLLDAGYASAAEACL